MAEKKKDFILKESKTETTENYKLPKILFSTFIMSLNASVLVSLGVMKDPATGGENKNLILGKQTIDLLDMLQEKTAGNLTPDESKMLNNILYDLKIIYVKETG